MSIDKTRTLATVGAAFKPMVTIPKVDSPTADSQQMQLGFSEATTIRIVSEEGYFTDSTLTENYGRTLTIPANNNMMVYVANYDTDLVIPMSKMTYGVFAPDERHNTHIFDISLAKYAPNLTQFVACSSSGITGDIANLASMTGLTRLSADGTQVSGDISSLSSMTGLVYLKLYSTQVSGDIANLANMTKIMQLMFANTQVSGDIANLSSMTGMTQLQLQNTQVSGDIANLANMKLKYFYGGSTQVYGDISYLPKTCERLDLSTNTPTGGAWGWTAGRRTGSDCTVLTHTSRINLGSSVDDYLIDQAGCGKVVTSGNWWNTSSINIKGTRTSASDAAVATLQGMGLTVSVTS